MFPQDAIISIPTFYKVYGATMCNSELILK